MSIGIGDLRDEPRRSDGGERRITLREWRNRVRAAEDVAAEYGGEEEFLDLLLAHVSSGRYLKEIADGYGADRNVLMTWIRKDTDRERRFQAAVADGKVVRQERVGSFWHRAMDEVSGEPTWGEAIRASQLAAQADGLLRDGAGSTSVHVHAGANSLIAILSGLDAPQQEPIDSAATLVADSSATDEPTPSSEIEEPHSLPAMAAPQVAKQTAKQAVREML